MSDCEAKYRYSKEDIQPFHTKAEAAYLKAHDGWPVFMVGHNGPTMGGITGYEDGTLLLVRFIGDHSACSKPKIHADIAFHGVWIPD